MSEGALNRIEEDIVRIGKELWRIDGSNDAFNKLLERVSQLKAQLEYHISFQGTANLLRKQPINKALPHQQATKVKHLVRFVFRKHSRGGDRSKELRKLPCDALKLCGLTYTTEEIVRLEDLKFDFVKHHTADFLCHRRLSRLLYRPDVDKAVDAKVENVDDDGSYEHFIQDHVKKRLELRKRKYDETADNAEGIEYPPTQKSSHISGDGPSHGERTEQHNLDQALECDTRSNVHFDSGYITRQPEVVHASRTTTLLKAIRIEKHSFQHIIREHPSDILGGIWFGSVQGYPPFVSVRLPTALDTMVRPSCQEVYIPEPSPGAAGRVTGTYLISLGVFKHMLERDGFGEIFWNNCGKEVFVTLLVIDEGLAEDFIRNAET